MRATTNIKNAFSLIELMVVIAIVALLAAIAIPAYKNHVVRTKVANAVNGVQDVADKIIQQTIKKGQFHAPVLVDGVSVNGSAYFLYNYPGLAFLYYQAYAPSNGFIVCAHATGLEGIPNYVAPNASGFSTGQYASFCVKVIENDGLFYKYCGHYLAHTPGDIPMSYLPTKCKCTGIDSIWSPTSAC